MPRRLKNQSRQKEKAKERMLLKKKAIPKVIYCYKETTKAGKKGAASKKEGADDIWKIVTVSNTLTDDIKAAAPDLVAKIVKTDLANFDLEDDEVPYEESENRKALQDYERDIGRKLRDELIKIDKFMNVIIGNEFSVKLLKNYPHADFTVGPVRVFVFRATRHMK